MIGVAVTSLIILGVTRIQSSFKLAKRKSISEVTPYVGVWCKLKRLNIRDTLHGSLHLTQSAKYDGPPLPYYVAHPCRLYRCSDFDIS